MSAPELREHRRYLADEVRTTAYRAALAEVIREGDTVVDLGAGTGVLGCFACEAGAASVTAIDCGEILDLACQVAADNGHRDRITHVRGLSTEMRLDERADVVVCDQVGGLVYDAGILVFFADARARLLVPDGRLVPAWFRIFLRPVRYDAGREAIDFWASKPSSLDVSAARAIAANTEWHCTTGIDGAVALAAGAEMASFPSDHHDPIIGSASFVVENPGRMDGLVGWFEAQLSPSVTLTNNPWSPDRFDRWWNFYPLVDPPEVVCGDRITVRIDIRPRLELISWSTEIERVDGGNHRTQQSTFNGEFLSLTTLGRFDLDSTVPDSDRAKMVRAVLDMIDGNTTQREIMRTLHDHVGKTFVSQAQLEAFVRQIASLVR